MNYFEQFRIIGPPRNESDRLFAKYIKGYMIPSERIRSAILNVGFYLTYFLITFFLSHRVPHHLALFLIYMAYYFIASSMISRYKVCPLSLAGRFNLTWRVWRITYKKHKYESLIVYGLYMGYTIFLLVEIFIYYCL